jgi:hypothetical protein
MRASRAFDLPCPWVPLQSMTAAASRRTPGWPQPAASCGGKGSARFRSSGPGPGCAGRPKASGAGPSGRSLGDPGSARSRGSSDRSRGAGVRPGPVSPLVGLPKQPHSRRRTESDDDFPGFGPFRRFDSGDRCAGLPHRHLPLSGFLTLTAVSSRPGLVALFHATSAPRVSVFRALPVRSAVAPLGVLCSLAVPPSWGRGE